MTAAMLEARTDVCIELKKIIAAFTEALDFEFDGDAKNETPALIECTSEGLTLQAIDEHSVVLGILHLDASFFKFYSCDRPVSLSIDLYHFNKAVEYATAKDHALMEISEEEKVLSISFQKPNGRTKARFDLNASQSKFKKFILDNDVYDGVFQIPSCEFSKIIETVSVFGTSTVIEWDKKLLSFSSTGVSGSSKMTVVPKSITNLSESGSKEFSSKYLVDMADAEMVSKAVSLSLSKRHVPLKVQMNIVNEGNRIGFIQYFLGPLVFEKA